MKVFSCLLFVGTVTISPRVISLGTKPKHRSMSMSVNDFVSVVAGATSGTVGVLISYPFDSIKTKIQTIAASNVFKVQDLNFFQMTQIVMREEDISSLYVGVKGSLIGNSIVKACSFSTFHIALLEISGSSTSIPSFDQLCMAAAFSGFLTSFIVNPIERIKIIIQSKGKDKLFIEDQEAIFPEIKVISQVLKSDGFRGLAFRGLDATLAREIPGYTLDFVIYYSLVLLISLLCSSAERKIKCI